MKRACRLTVVMQRGRIVGTQETVDVDRRPAPKAAARLRAGPGQRLVEIVADLPDNLSTPKAIERFHAGLLPLVRKARSRRRSTR